VTIRRRWAIGATAVSTAVAFARADAAPAVDGTLRCGTPPAVTRAVAWASPLDRRVTLAIDGLTLRDALTRVATTANIRLTYVAELLPLDRVHCTALSQVAVGDALTTLLAGTAVSPIAAGRDQVVLSPTTADAQARARAAVRVGTLDRVIVTGRRGNGTALTSAFAVDVIDGRALEARGASTLAAALNGAVPGLWIWNNTPGSATLRLGSLRGASSFGASAPKVYIDGIEVANPLVLTQLRPETVDRVEVIRGPQGSALYGADAIGGVLQITTRHDPAAGPGLSTTLRTSAGLAPREGGGSVATQDHALQLRAGTQTRAGGLAFASSSIGDYVASGAAQQWNASGDLKLIGDRRSLVASARFFSQEANNPNLLRATMATGVRGSTSTETRSPSATGGPGGRSDDGARTLNVPSAPPGATSTSGTEIAPQSTQQYTIGATVTQTGTDWTTRLVAGADGYRLANPIAELGVAGSAADSALRAASGAADRLTLRVLSSRNATVSNDISATISVGGEHTTLRDASNTPPSSASLALPTSSLTRHSTGALLKTDLAWHNQLFLTAGGRLEQNLGYTSLTQFSFLPTLGMALQHQLGHTQWTLRSAWGRAIRPPRTPALANGLTTTRPLLAATLEPEIQSGLETGLDLSVGSILNISITHFDQRASGLIQASLVTADLAPWRQQNVRRTATALQNVGVIANRGWELSTKTHLGAAGLSASLATVSSTVAHVVPGYLGDLRLGDRMLDVPALTAGLSADWTTPLWSASLGSAFAGNWIGYDRAAIARDLSSGARTREQLTGAVLRRYWRKYDGVNRLRASFSRTLGNRLVLSMMADNLLDVRQGEPDNLTLLPGRTISAGVRARF
jgi:iron complex outermembrane recepter protein